MEKKIKWGCIQPLTGGMYIGTRAAIGHDADWIISYDGLNSVKYNKDGKIETAANEYNLLQWFNKNGISVPYYTFKHKMFERQPLDKVEITSNDNEFTNDIYNDIDLVVAVPVCSGLSQATIANEETCNKRNCNMEFITEYTLNVVKPKVYVFENAPGLVGAKGEPVRNELEKIALSAGYSIMYYKTDTVYHHNCQKRPRTFVVFMKWQNEMKPQLPHAMNKQHDTISVEDYFDLIPSNATQNDITCEMTPINKALLSYFLYKYGDDWRNVIDTIHYFTYILDNKLTDDFLAYAHTMNFTESELNKIDKYIEHVLYKTSHGLNYYSTTIWGYDVATPSVMFKTMQSALHHKENRLWTIREALWLMGMPNDFELYGSVNNNASKIGQNVPVNTAKWIASEAVRIIKNWDVLPAREYNEKNCSFTNNIKK